MANGTYQFVHTTMGQGECSNTAATLTVRVNENGNPGTNGNIVACSSSTVDLTSGLGTFDAGGSWTDDDNSGVDLFDPANVALAGLATGSYDFTYTLSATTGCSNGASATVTVDVTAEPDPGSDNAISICDGSIIDLTASLGGNPDIGGNWTEVTSSGVSIADPANVDFSGAPVGRYEFTYTITNTICGDQTSTLIVNAGQTHSAGSDASLDVCNTTTDLDLVSAISSPDPGGVWEDTDNMGVDLSNPTSVSLNGVPAGNYRITHTHDGDNGCATSMAVLTVSVSESANAGQSTTLQFCSGAETQLDFFSSLDGNPNTGGTWVDADGTGLSLSDPSDIDLSGLTAGSYHFNYVVSNAGSCNPATATLVIDILDHNIAGTPITETLQFCIPTSELIDLKANLTGFDDGGIWTVDGIMVTDTVLFDPNGLEPGFHEVNYDFAASGTCTASNARYYIEIQQGADAGDPGLIDLCNDADPINLFDVIEGSADTNGTWTDLDDSGANITTPTSVSFEGVAAGTYIFQYEVPNNDLCANDDSNEITVVLSNAPNAGEDTRVIIEPSDGTLIDLDGELGSSIDTGGTWIADDPGIVDLTDPSAVEFMALEDGIYGFTYSLEGTGACQESSSRLIVELNQNTSESTAINPSFGFSPNGDGINDFWAIQGIEETPENKVFIYNGWGSLVFKIENYNNQDRRFEGVANQSVVGSNVLNSGTYFYVIEADGSAQRSGYFTLLK